MKCCVSIWRTVIQNDLTIFSNRKTYHLLTYFFTHSLTHSLTHALTHSLDRLLARWLSHPLSHSLAQSLARRIRLCLRGVHTVLSYRTGILRIFENNFLEHSTTLSLFTYSHIKCYTFSCKHSSHFEFSKDNKGCLQDYVKTYTVNLNMTLTIFKIWKGYIENENF